MATGDQIPGQIRVNRVTTQGTEIPVLKDLNQDRVDYSVANSTASVNKLFINAHLPQVGAPGDAETRRTDMAEFFPGETFRVKHTSNTDNSRSIQVDNADIADIGIVEQDVNTGERRTSSLTNADQELTSTPSESASSFVTFYEFTVPDRTQIALAGSFEAVAIEV